LNGRLFLDEPFTALDSPTRQALLEFESVLGDENQTVIVTHDRMKRWWYAAGCVLINGNCINGYTATGFNYPNDEKVRNLLRPVIFLWHSMVQDRD